jgi:hypothetical protein
VLALGVSALWAWLIDRGDSTETAALSAPTARAPLAAGSATAPDVTGTEAIGRIVLDFAHGALRVHPGEPGEPTRVEATYDTKVYTLTDDLSADETDFWVYTVRFRRSAPMLVSMFHDLMGGEDPIVDVYLSPDDPIEVVFDVEQAGVEADLAGLWITDLTAEARQAGGRIAFEEPLHAPMRTLKVATRMGGFELVDVANAAPRGIDIRCRLGGVELDMEGPWDADVDVRVDVTMGGVDVTLPDDARVLGLDTRRGTDRMRRGDPERPVPTVRFDVSARMGGVDAR